MNELPIWSFLFGILSVYPFFPLRHVPVMDRLKISFWKLMLYATAIMVVQGVSYLWLSQQYSFGTAILAWHRKLFMIPYVLLTLTFSKDSKSKTLFMDFFMVGIVMSVIDLAYIIDRTWFYEAFIISPYRTDVFVRSAITLLLYPPLYLLFKNSLRPVMKIETVTVWPYLTAIPLTFAVVSIITTMEAFNHEISPVILSIRLSIILGSVLVSALLSKVVRQMESAVKAEEKNRQSERLLALQSEQYAALTRNMEQTRAARHDLRHQLAVISAMVEDKEYNNLKEFVERYRKSVPTDTEINFCENYAANSVMSHYFAIAKMEAINSIDVRCTLGEDSHVEDLDLCVLIGNLFENAIEGCKTLPVNERKIKLRMSNYLGQLLLTIDNTFDGNVKMVKDEILSRKRGNGQKGVGISSVEAIVQKYGGEIRWEQKSALFMVSVLL